MVQSFQIFGITFYPYSLFMIAGAVVCFLMFFYLTFTRHKQCFDENLFVIQMVVIAMGLALPTAILLDSLFKYIETGEFLIKGATFYGGLLCALPTFALLTCLKKDKKINLYDRFCDLAPCIAIGHSLGRIGCFMGGCCFGSETDCIFGVVFPVGSPAYEYYGGFVTVHPTQLYEAVYLFLIGAFLIFAKKNAFPLYLIIYGVGRIFIEFFRNDSRGSVGLPMSPAQLISIALILVATIVLTSRLKKLENK